MTEIPYTRAIQSATEIYEYVSADGHLDFIVCRWDAHGDKKKRFAQYHTEDGKWIAKAPPSNLPDGSSYLRPVYGLIPLLEDRTLPVLVVEGERTFKVAQQYLPAGWLIATWSGGDAAVNKTDWAPLIGRRVVIWPDNDAGGIQAGHKIAALTDGFLITPPDGLPVKWDLANPLPDFLTSDAVRALILREPPPPPDLIEKPPALAADDPEYLPLGTDGNRAFYFLTVHSGKVMDRNSRELRDYNGCMDLVTNSLYWSRRCGSDKGIDFKRAGDELITECRARGLFDETLARGRGVWRDPLGIVVHTGNSVYVDGKETHPVAIKSRNFYPLKTSLFPSFKAPPMSDDEGQLVREVCGLVRWEKPIYGLFLAGLIATAPICGSLRWRTHGWVTGSRGTGKTWVLDEIVGRLLDHIALKVLGETTAPGIRSALDNDARPVIFDESEGENPKGQARIDDLIGLMRAASRQTDAKILKGSSNHKSVSFDIQAQFICGAISTGLKRAADATRTLVLTMKAPPDVTDADKRAAADHFKMLEAAVKKFPADVSVRLLKRMASLVPVVRANADIFMRLIARKYADARIGDQVGTVLAGAWALTSKSILTEPEAMKILSKIDWASLAQGPSSDDGQTMINHLVSHRVTVRNVHGVGHDRTVGELIGIAAKVSVDVALEPKQAADSLLRIGMRMETGAGDVNGCCIARRHPHLDKLFENSDYPGGYATLLARFPGAEHTEAKRFAGVQTRAIWLPVDMLIGSSSTGLPGQASLALSGAESEDDL